MSKFLHKLTSRKFLACVAGVVIGLCVAFKADAGTVQTVAGAVESVVSLITYIITEGRIDAASVATTVTEVQAAADAVKKIDGFSANTDTTTTTTV